MYESNDVNILISRDDVQGVIIRQTDFLLECLTNCPHREWCEDIERILEELKENLLL